MQHIANLLLSLLFAESLASAQSLTSDLEYARVGDLSLKLDLHLPKATNPPLLVYVHGGAWRGGSKTDVPIAKLLDHGFAIASVDYRLSGQAPFPAQVYDIKAAIRYLRAKAGLFHINANHIAIIGSSAGGHLAALVGVTNGLQELEGNEGDYLTQSSDVQCIISLFGASNLQSILGQSTEFGLKMRVPALQLLLGGSPSEKPELAKLASPVTHVDKKDPPLLLIHGDADPQMPPQQSEELLDAYMDRGSRVQYIRLPGSKHGGTEFYDAKRTEIMASFLAAAFGIKE
jgi:acetyl esterase/lipase